ncbi:hypothetical protein FBY34_8606 [Streptomyces sp. SLBN-115]|nr:hypothetical protein FBY34_8606 [Streptomyces sp. SLBN-115]
MSLHDRLESLEWISDAEFEAYGMNTAGITEDPRGHN